MMFRACAALYIGDGMSTANLIIGNEAASLVDHLHGRQVPVIGYAIGPRIDVPLLACLAGKPVAYSPSTAKT